MQQELGEIAEGDGVAAGDASLGQEEESLGEGAVDVGGGGEVGAERFERGERSLACTPARARAARAGDPILAQADFFMRQKRRDWHALLPLDNTTTWLLIGSMMNAELRALHSASASVREGELAAVGVELVRRLVGERV